LQGFSGEFAKPDLSHGIEGHLIFCREQLTEQLAQAERIIEYAFELIARQSELVKRLQRDGDDPIEAKHLLAELKELLAIHFADRDRLRELARSEE
jgi:hypothetical protein